MGGLGNQLFIYAFCIQQNKSGVVYKIVTPRKDYISHYFIKHNLYPREDLIKKIIVLFCKLIDRSHWYKVYNKWFTFSEKLTRIRNREDYNLQLIKIQDSSFIECFFQSRLFFNDLVKSELNNLFQLKYNYVHDYKNLIKTKQDSLNIVIHVRRGDYKTFGNKNNHGGEGLCLPISYYINSISKIKNIDSYKILIVTDDKNYVKDNFSFIKHEIIGGNEIQDFQVIMNADIVILSNSTFSFWGSFLNKRAKANFIPEYWLGFHIKKRVPEHIFSGLPANYEVVDF